MLGSRRYVCKDLLGGCWTNVMVFSASVIVGGASKRVILGNRKDL